MWVAIDTFDVSQINPADLQIFEYEGFNPDEVLRAPMPQQRINKIRNSEVMRDIAVLCDLAVTKGNVNDNNFKKMRKDRQDTFLKLQE